MRKFLALGFENRYHVVSINGRVVNCEFEIQAATTATGPAVFWRSRGADIDKRLRPM